MIYIEELLSKLEKLEPLNTGVEPLVYCDSEIKCVIFDIYGTLLISSSGDIDLAEFSTKNLHEAFLASNIELIEKSERALKEILIDFASTIHICHNEARCHNIPFPEVDILSVWEIVLIVARRKNLISFNGDANIMQMTCIFEFLSNKVYPMPGMLETITDLRNRFIPIGIVSNAQFYTPVLMNYFINHELSLEEKIHFFDQELTVFSYKLGIGKPDNRLFKELIPVIEKKYKLKPSEVLYIGNDMLKDIYTSKEVGFKTALFAGDRRSLRMHSSNKKVNSIHPDFIITDLQQIFKIIQQP